MASHGSPGVSGAGSREYRITQAPLGDIFGPPSIFSIPDYTRAFCWPVAQVQTLLEDLKLAAQSGSEQFLGTLTFSHQANAGEPPEVVDGQQRMVTLFLVLSYMHHWASVSGLHELRACLWRCLCHDQGTNSDGTRWVTYRLNFAHQAIAKFFKENLLDNFMPVVFVEADAHPFSHSEQLGAVPMPNRLMWHLYKIGGHVKRHMDTILQTDSGPMNAERLIVHILSKCFVVAVLCQGKERGPAIFAHLNSTGVPLSSNDCLKAKLLAKLPPVHHPSFLAKWREMEEILGEVEIRKFLEYVKQLEEFMGTMPQLQDAYQYFSLKIASVDNSKPIIDGIFSHASVFIQRTKLKRLHEMNDMQSGGPIGMGHMQQSLHLSQPVSSSSHHRPGGLHSAMSISVTSSATQQPGNGNRGMGGMVNSNSSHHGGGNAKAALENLASSPHDAFPATAPARLELLGNSEILNSLLAQQQGIHAETYALEGSLHGADRMSMGGGMHGADRMGMGGSMHGPSDRLNRSGSLQGPGGSQHGPGGSYHGGGGYYGALQAAHAAGGSQHGLGGSFHGGSQHGMPGSPHNGSQHGPGGSHHGENVFARGSQHGAQTALGMLQQQQARQQQQQVGNAGMDGQVASPTLSQPHVGSGDNGQGNPGQLSSNCGAPDPSSNPDDLNGGDPFNWCPRSNDFGTDYFRESGI